MDVRFENFKRCLFNGRQGKTTWQCGSAVWLFFNFKMQADDVEYACNLPKATGYMHNSNMLYIF